MPQSTPSEDDYPVVYAKGAFPEHAHVPLTVWVKEGKLVGPGEGHRLVIGEAVVENGRTVSSTYHDLPPEIMEMLFGKPERMSFSLVERDPELLPPVVYKTPVEDLEGIKDAVMKDILNERTHLQDILIEINQKEK